MSHSSQDQTRIEPLAVSTTLTLFGQYDSKSDELKCQRLPSVENCWSKLLETVSKHLHRLIIECTITA